MPFPGDQQTLRDHIHPDDTDRLDRRFGVALDHPALCMPFSAIAGVAHLLKRSGVAPAQVLILGAGVVGTNAMQMAVGLGARVTVVDRNVDRLRQLDLVYGNRIATVFSTAHAIDENLVQADLVIGGVLIPGAAAPKLVSRAMVARMKPGAVVVDVAIDQGGCFETSHATTHAELLGPRMHVIVKPFAVEALEQAIGKIMEK